MSKGVKVLNLRNFLFLFLSLALGIFFCYQVRYRSLSPLFLLIVPFLFLLPCVLAQNKRRGLFVFALCFLFFALGFLLFERSADAFLHRRIADGTLLLAGKVKERSFTSFGYRYLLSDLNGNGEKIVGNLVFYDARSFEAGDFLSGTFSLKNTAMGNGDYFASEYVEKSIFYTAVSEGELTVTGHSFSLFGAVRSRIFSVLSSACEGELARVCYALLTGDEGGMGESLIQNIRYGGMAHIFAVSGLHIGVIYSAVRFLCRKIKLPRLAVSLVAAACIAFYLGVCSFSSSAMRSALMCVTLDSSFYRRKKVDFVENISLVGILLLLFCPSNVFSAGFSLSFLAVYGIAFIGGSVERRLKKGNIRRQIGGVVSASVAVNLAIFPVLLDCFSYVSLWGLLLNLLILPLFSLVFVLLFFGTALSCLLPFASPVLLFIPKIFVGGTVFLFTYIDFSPFAVRGFSFGLAKITYYVMLVVVCEKVNLSRPVRAACGIILLLSTLVQIFFGCLILA